MTNGITCHEALPNVPQAVGPYSPAVTAGDFIFLSGQVPLDPSSGTLVSDNISEQTQQVLQNLESVLSALGTSFNHVVKTTIFLTDLTHFQTVNKLYESALGGHKPARSTIEVKGLPLGALVEMEMIVKTPDGSA
jgi:2-iminobutanoate/2-iminopropanoate deaminase